MMNAATPDRREEEQMAQRVNGAEVVTTWVRVGLVVLAIPQAITGLWAILDPEGWFADFPGFDPRRVAAEPPFNSHLAADAGAGFLATAVALLVAAWWAQRQTVLLALITYLAFTVPHLIYHAANPAPGLSSGEDVRNVTTLVIAVVAAVVLGWAARAPHRRAQT
jgi:hypothetical protein